MPAFDKNQVQIQFAYSIRVDDAPKTTVLPCPRCGHLNERKHNRMCLSCKRFIPPTDARTEWSRTLKNPFAQVCTLVGPNKIEPELKFKLMKVRGWGFLRTFRQCVYVAAAGAFVYFSAPIACKMILGPDGMQQLENKVHIALSPTTYGLQGSAPTKIAAVEKQSTK